MGRQDDHDDNDLHTFIDEVVRAVARDHRRKNDPNYVTALILKGDVRIDLPAGKVADRLRSLIQMLCKEPSLAHAHSGPFPISKIAGMLYEVGLKSIWHWMQGPPAAKVLPLERLPIDNHEGRKAQIEAACGVTLALDSDPQELSSLVLDFAANVQLFTSTAKARAIIRELAKTAETTDALVSSLEDLVAKATDRKAKSQRVELIAIVENFKRIGGKYQGLVELARSVFTLKAFEMKSQALGIEIKDKDLLLTFLNNVCFAEEEENRFEILKDYVQSCAVMAGVADSIHLPTQPADSWEDFFKEAEKLFGVEANMQHFLKKLFDNKFSSSVSLIFDWMDEALKQAQRRISSCFKLEDKRQALTSSASIRQKLFSSDYPIAFMQAADS